METSLPIERFPRATAIAAARINTTHVWDRHGNSAVYSFLDAPTPGNNLGGRLINTILTTSPDNFAGNDNDLLNGNVQEADYSGSFTGLTQEGSYRVSVSGTGKDNLGTNGSQPFTVTGGGTVIGG